MYRPTRRASDVLFVPFPDDENRGGSRNAGLLAIKPPDTAASPINFE